MSLLKDFEALCKYVRECTGDDIVCGLCEYDAGTVGEEPMECPGFDSNECFKLKESLRKQYEMYDQVIRCKDCKYYREDGLTGEEALDEWERACAERQNNFLNDYYNDAEVQYGWYQQELIDLRSMER